MANKTNCKKGNIDYYRISRTIKNKRPNRDGVWETYRKDFYGINKKDAESKYHEFLESIKHDVVTTDLCFGEIADHYVYHVFAKGNNAIGTKEKYTRVYEQILRPSYVSGMHISEISSRDFQEIYNTATCAPSTLRAVNNILKLIYKYIEHERYGKDVTHTLVVPASKKKSKGNKDIVIWSENEIATIFSSLNDERFRLLLHIAYYTGARIGELLALEYSNLSLSSKMMRIESQIVLEPTVENDKVTGRQPTETPILKTCSSYRTVPLNDNLIAEIVRHKKWQKDEMSVLGYETDYLFTTRTGSFYDQSNIGKTLRRFYKKIGVPYKTFHAYRHTFATMLARSGERIEITATLLGHASTETTRKYYISVSDDELINAVRNINIRPLHVVVSK